MYKVKEITPAAAREVTELLAQLTGVRDELIEVAEQIRIVDARDYCRLVGVYDDGDGAGRPVGLGVAVLFENICPSLSPTMLIETVVVDEAYRRQGIGTMIVRHFERIAGDAGCRYITLNSQKSRTPAHEMYKKLGYTQDYSFQKIKNPDIG